MGIYSYYIHHFIHYQILMVTTQFLTFSFLETIPWVAGAFSSVALNPSPQLLIYKLLYKNNKIYIEVLTS